MRKHGLLGIAVLLGALALGGCTGRGGSGADDPKKALGEYISRTFSVKSFEDRESLLKQLTGSAKLRLAAWSEEQFRQAFMDSKRQFLKLVVREVKNQGPKEVSITYELTYLDQGRGSGAKITNRKLAQMILDGERWLISDVRNIKELVEYQNELSLP